MSIHSHRWIQDLSSAKPPKMPKSDTPRPYPISIPEIQKTSQILTTDLDPQNRQQISPPKEFS